MELEDSRAVLLSQLDAATKREESLRGEVRDFERSLGTASFMYIILINYINK